MVKRTSLKKAECPVARALDAIGDWWSLLIVRDAFDGMRRFSEFQKSLGASRGILSNRLRSLVHLGILKRIPASDGSDYKEYALTAKGQDLFLVLVSLRQWGEKHLYDTGEAHSLLMENATGQPVPKLEFRSGDGRVLDWSATYVHKVPQTKA